MEDLIEMLAQIAALAVSAVITTYGTMALQAVRKRATNDATKAFIDILEKTIESGVAYAAKEGIDKSAANWLTQVMVYTKNSIPETLAREGISDDALRTKIESLVQKRQDVERRYFSGSTIPLSGLDHLR